MILAVDAPGKSQQLPTLDQSGIAADRSVDDAVGLHVDQENKRIPPLTQEGRHIRDT
jgi:hypothetical protein